MKKFNLGSGDAPLHDYIGIDYIPGLKRDNFICHDLRNGLPEVCRDAEMFVSTHFFEHLYDQEARKLMRECLDFLSPGGVFRIGVPNFRSMVENYLKGNWDFWSVLGSELDRISPKETRSIIDICTFGVYQYDSNELQCHKSIWDIDKLIKVLQHIGYKEVKEVEYDYSKDPPCELRRRYTIVCEGIKDGNL